MIDRVMRRLTEDPVTGCWVFAGALNNKGYGVVGAGPRGTGNVVTHRVTYEYFVGSVPDGLDLDHLCRNRACCNPWHLDPVSRLTNIMRGRHPWVLRDPVALKKAQDARRRKTA